MPKALIFFAPGLEECEGLLCVDLLRRVGVTVTIAAVGGDRHVTSARGITVLCDALAEEVDADAYDAVLLPGGFPGVTNLKNDAAVRRVCTRFLAEGKLVGAICAAPSALAAFGLLRGRRVTVYPGEDLIAAVKAGGAEYTAAPVTEDGSLITGQALGAGIPFALALAARLAGPEAAARVGSAIVYPG